ncbi:hypothetical protein KIL84_007473 [Mauremys mutica]|uniref:Uncharacterized protein n=1 Tax=Mauremys mutica TaxID=74926 RepID=A0A9D4AX43_9SAUR|nr:hypothetical protein KIL84_007473 [Mauremys mutica]
MNIVLPSAEPKWQAEPGSPLPAAALDEELQPELCRVPPRNETCSGDTAPVPRRAGRGGRGLLLKDPMLQCQGNPSLLLKGHPRSVSDYLGAKPCSSLRRRSTTTLAWIRHLKVTFCFHSLATESLDICWGPVCGSKGSLSCYQPASCWTPPFGTKAAQRFSASSG